MGETQPMPEPCRTCTQYLNDELPEPSCYTSCPKTSPVVAEIENSLNLNVTPTRPLKTCPRCQKQSLFWNKHNLTYECLVCKGTYTAKQLQKNAHPIQNRRNTTEANGETTEQRTTSKTQARLTAIKRAIKIRRHRDKGVPEQAYYDVYNTYSETWADMTGHLQPRERPSMLSRLVFYLALIVTALFLALAVYLIWRG